MKCPECETENPDVARFCLRCGARLLLVCGECQTELPTDAAFRFACGTRVAARPDEIGEEPAAADAVADRLRRLVPRAFAEQLLAPGGQMAAERRIGSPCPGSSRAPRPRVTLASSCSDDGAPADRRVLVGRPPGGCFRGLCALLAAPGVTRQAVIATFARDSGQRSPESDKRYRTAWHHR
jgi:hypothetical protein